MLSSLHASLCHRPGCAAGADAVLEAFVQLHDKGLIYRGNYLVNWAPKLQTAVSDLEVCALTHLTFQAVSQLHHSITSIWLTA